MYTPMMHFCVWNIMSQEDRLLWNFTISTVIVQTFKHAALRSNIPDGKNGCLYSAARAAP